MVRKDELKTTIPYFFSKVLYSNIRVTIPTTIMLFFYLLRTVKNSAFFQKATLHYMLLQ